MLEGKTSFHSNVKISLKTSSRIFKKHIPTINEKKIFVSFAISSLLLSFKGPKRFGKAILPNDGLIYTHYYLIKLNQRRFRG